MAVTPRKAGRPRKALLDRDRIAAAALELLDRTGDLNLPALARELGVSTASLYHHVEGRAGVVELLRERVADRLDLAALEDPSWEAAILGYFRSYRAAFAAHPRLVPLLTTTTVRSPQVLAAYELLIGRLVDAGVPVDQALTVATSIENFTLGAALDSAAPETMWEIPEGVEAPRLAAALAARAGDSGRAEEAFELGLTRLVSGIAELVDAR